MNPVLATYLQGADYCIRSGQLAQAHKYLLLALGVAKRAKLSYEAGRILTAIQWVKLIEAPGT